MANEKDIRIGKRTDVGKVRELNEDSFGTAGTFGIGWQQQKQRGTLVAVADGMGGHAAGEVASEMATQALFKTYYAAPDRDPRKALTAGYAEANRTVFETASKDATKTSMGTTLVAAAIKGGALCVANVGDSRAYLVRGKSIHQITNDHSWVAEQVRARVLSEEQAKQHVYKNIITRAIGNRPEVKPDFFRRELRAGDVIVLCSDGLSNKVESREIQAIVSRNLDPDQAAQELIALANERGGEDNITAVVVRVPGVPIRWSFVLATSGVLLALAATALLLVLCLFQINPAAAPPAATAIPMATETQATLPTIAPAPIAAPSETWTLTPTPTASVTWTSTPTPTSTATATHTPPPTATRTQTPTITAMPAATQPAPPPAQPTPKPYP
ncbi:MAG: Stp1/IreP family PP2C-type Ser/Thr phosphatase [Chloroflexota bacterium]|nr:Stp1/IreP family PP2C-type Ser/Thr phosphatase [Chloroflexota bacterium]